VELPLEPPEVDEALLGASANGEVSETANGSAATDASDTAGTGGTTDDTEAVAAAPVGDAEPVE
jgi:hypothetical protein